ncbi:MAG: hypothetical protein IJU14_00445 [Clostridia bacterium]|nr:hypothetical protein [Clostridia bacterium]
MNKKIIALITAIVILIISGFIVSVNLFRKNKPTTPDNTSHTPVKTEVGTNAQGENIVVVGTDPSGAKIENGTYADGTKVEIATTQNGEIATESNGEYVIIYPDSVSADVNSHNTSSNSENSENADSKSTTSTTNTDSSSKTNSSSKSDTSKPVTSKSDTSSSSSKPSSSSTPSSSKTTSSSKPNSSTPSSSKASSGEIVEPKTEKDTVSINGSQFKVGDTVRVSFYMQCDTRFTGVDLTVNYDGKVLTALDNVEAPNVASPESNTGLENRVRMIAVAAVAVNDFSSEKLLVSCDFKVKKISDNPSEIALQIEEMLDNDLANISSDHYTIRTEVAKI